MILDCPKNVQIAKKEDEDAIMAFLDDAHEDNGMFDMDKDRVFEKVKSATRRDESGSWEGGIIGLIKNAETIEASVGLFLSRFWYAKADKFFLSEHWVYVRPQFRKSENAKNLLDFSKWCSDTMHLPLHIGIMSTSRVAAKERLYRRKLPKVGALFVYDSYNPELKKVPEEEVM